MIIRKHVTTEEFQEEVKKWNESGLTAPSKLATLKEFMLVEDTETTDPTFRYHIYAENPPGYRLVNHLPFDIFLTNANGDNYGEEPTDYGHLI